ncbi:hypothetical protein V1289_008602 [Bradyrhizobium sp. AZCC 2289]
MNIFRAPLIAALTMVSWAAFAQQGTVRVITGDIEHIYGTGGQILDDDALRARNEHAERMRQIERDRQDAKRRQEELDTAAARADAAPAYDDPYWGGGSSYVGTFGGRHFSRHVN